MLIAGLGAAALVIGLSITPAAAAPLEALQNVSVQLGSDGALTSLSVTTAVRGESVTGEQVWLDPQADGARLPVRVTTAWQLGEERGTDLAALRGRNGRVTIDLTVENLTVRAQEVSVEDAGAKYRGTSLVGVPFTVVAATRLPEAALPTVITVAGDGSRVTNGVASRATSGETVVQWAALLAPPMVAPVTTFRLVMDADDFQPPEFDLTVQPGLAVDATLRDALTGPSGSLARALQHDTDTVDTVLDVMEQVQDGQELVDRLSKSLSGDAKQLGSQTYAEIKSSSAAMLAQLKATKTQLTALLQRTQTDIASAQSQVGQGMSALLTRLNNDVLGDTDADVPITAVPVRGCSITLPELAPDAPRTLASAVRLLDAQVGTIVATFDDTTDNCRETLIEQLKADVGDPAEQCLADATSIRCAIQEARDGLLTDRQRIADLKDQLRVQISQVGAAQLSAQASLLAGDLAALRGHVADLAQALDAADGTVGGIIPDLTSASDDAKARVAAIRAQIAATRPDAPDSVTDELTGLSGQATTLQGTLGDLAQALEELSSDDLATSQTAQGELTSALNPLLTAWDDLAGDPPAAQALPSGWQTTTIATVTDAMAGDPACPADWADGLTDTSTPAEVTAALTAVAGQAGCPAAALADLLASLVETQGQNQQGLERVSTVLSDAGTIDTAEISTKLGQIGTAVQEMSATLNANGSGVRDRLSAAQQALGDQLADPLRDAVTELTTRMDDMSALLDDLYDDSAPTPAADASGFLAEVDELIQRIQEATATGDLAEARTALAELSNRLNSTYTGDGTVPQGCVNPLPDPGAHPGPAADAVIWLSNQVSCGVQALDTTLDAWQDEVNAALDQAGTGLAAAIARTDAAVLTAVGNINAVSDGLVTGLAEQTQRLTQDSLDTIDRVKVDNEADIRAMTGSFRAATDAVVSEMTDQLGAASLDLDATRTRLAENFSAVLANLGSPEPGSRAGLLGKLRSSASLVGDTANVLDDLTGTVADQAGTLSAWVAYARLQTAGLQAAQDRLADLPAFVAAPPGAQTLVVYSFRVLGS